MKSNPLIERYLFSILRPSRLYTSIILYIGLLMVIFIINLTISIAGHYDNASQLCRSIFVQFTVFQAVVFWLWIPNNCFAAIRDEVTEKSYDFFKMLPLSASQKTWGILVGKNAAALAVGAVNFIIMLFVVPLSAISIWFFIQLFVLIITSSLLAASLMLLVSLNSTHKKKTNSNMAVIIPIVFVGPWLFGFIANIFRNNELESATGKFFVFSLPLLTLLSCLTIYFTAWTLKGLSRKFNKENEPLMNGTGALLFFAGAQVVTLGLFWNTLDSTVGFCGFLTTSASVLFTVPLFSMLKLEHYLEILGAQSASSNRNQLTASLLKNSNISLDLLLMAVWIGFAAAAAIISVSPFITHLLGTIAMLFLIVLLGSLLKEIYCLFRFSLFLVLFVSAVIIVVPMVLGAVFESKTISWFSPLGFFVNMTSGFVPSAALFYGVLCIIPAMFVIQKYKTTINSRFPKSV